MWVGLSHLDGSPEGEFGGRPVAFYWQIPARESFSLGAFKGGTASPSPQLVDNLWPPSRGGRSLVLSLIPEA